MIKILFIISPKEDSLSDKIYLLYMRSISYLKYQEQILQGRDTVHMTSRDYRMVDDRDFGHLVSAEEQRVFTFTRKGIDKTFSYQVAYAITTILQVNKIITFLGFTVQLLVDDGKSTFVPTTHIVKITKQRQLSLYYFSKRLLY